MYIGKYRLPIMSSLLIWAVVWEIAGRTGASFIIPPLSRIFARIIEIVPTAAFGDALWITGKAFILGNIIAIGIGVPLGVLMGRSDPCRPHLPALGQHVPVRAAVGAGAGHHGGVRRRPNHHRAHRGALRHLDRGARRAGGGEEHHAVARRNGPQLRGQPLPGLQQDLHLGGVAGNSRRHPPRAHPCGEGRGHRAIARSPSWVSGGSSKSTPRVS